MHLRLINSTSAVCVGTWEVRAAPQHWLYGGLEHSEACRKSNPDIQKESSPATTLHTENISCKTPMIFLCVNLTSSFTKDSFGQSHFILKIVFLIWAVWALFFKFAMWTHTQKMRTPTMLSGWKKIINHSFPLPQNRDP